MDALALAERHLIACELAEGQASPEITLEPEQRAESRDMVGRRLVCDENGKLVICRLRERSCAVASGDPILEDLLVDLCLELVDLEIRVLERARLMNDAPLPRFRP